MPLSPWPPPRGIVDSAQLVGADGKKRVRVNAAQLAEETGLPAPTVQKLVSRLTAAGLLRSSRGIGGGLKLARPAAAISSGRYCRGGRRPDRADLLCRSGQARLRPGTGLPGQAALARGQCGFARCFGGGGADAIGGGGVMGRIGFTRRRGGAEGLPCAAGIRNRPEHSSKTNLRNIEAASPRASLLRASASPREPFFASIQGASI